MDGYSFRTSKCPDQVRIPVRIPLRTHRMMGILQIPKTKITLGGNLSSEKANTIPESLPESSHEKRTFLNWFDTMLIAP